MVEKILNNTTPYGKIRASHEGSLHSSTLIDTYNVYHNSYLIHIFTLTNIICQDIFLIYTIKQMMHNIYI